MKKILLLLIASMTTIMVGATAVYKPNALHGGKVQAYTFTIEMTGFGPIMKKMTEAVKIPNGKYVTLKDTSYYYGDPTNDAVSNFVSEFGGEDASFAFALIEYKDSVYAVEAHDLVFSKRKSDQGEHDYLEYYHKSANERFWNKPLPFIIIFVLLLCGALGVLFAPDDNKEKAVKLLFVNACITLLVALMEMIAIFSVGSEMFWWLSIDRYGLFRSIFRLIPLLIAAVLQFGGMYLFLETVNRIYGTEEKKVTLKPIFRAMLYPFIGCVVLLIIVGITVNNDFLMLLVLLASLAVMGYFLWRQMKTYQDILGMKMGILFTIYIVVWVFSAILAAIFYTMGFLKVIVPVLISIAILAGAFFALGGAFSLKGVSRVRNYNLMDKSGVEHQSGVGRDEANKYL